MVELHVVLSSEHCPRYTQRRLAGVNAMESSDPWREKPGPAAGAATGIKALCTFGEVIPREDRRVELEHLLQLSVRQSLVRET